MAVGTLVFDQCSYRNVLCLGPHPGRGRPQDVQAPGQHPRADPADGPARRRRAALVHARPAARPGRPAGSATRRSRRSRRKRCCTYWTGRRSSRCTRAPTTGRRRRRTRRRAEPAVLDRWALSELHRLVRRGRRGAGELRHPAGRQAARRRTSTTCRTGTCAAPAGASGMATRPRWPPCTSACRRLTRLLAPLVPFVTERVWQDAVRGDPARRTRCTWPRGRRPTRALVDAQLAEQVGLVRRLVELGRAARAESGVKTRQPLGPRADLGRPAGPRCPTQLRDPGRRRAQRRRTGRAGRRPAASWSSIAVKPNFRALGRRFGKRTQPVANAIAAADPTGSRRAAAGAASVEVEGEPIESAPTRSSSPRPRGRAGRWPRPAPRRWRSTWRSPTSCGWPAWLRDVVRLSRTPARTPASR